MSWKKYKFGDFLKRSKITVDILDDVEYKRVTIKTKHQGVSVRDIEKGKKIGTKKQFILKSGQFVLSKIDARYGAFGIAPVDVDGSIITGNFWAYDVDFSIINIDWFNQFTNSQDFYNVCERASSGITHRKYLNENFFLNYEIDLPSVEEQLIIVESLKSNKKILSNQSKELNHQLSFVNQLRQAFLREAIQGKLVPRDPNGEPASVLLEKIKAEKELLFKEKKIKKEKPLPPIAEDEIPFEIPKNWVWCRLGEVAQIKRGTGPKYSEKGVFKMLNQKCVRWFIIQIEYCKAIDENWYNTLNDDFKISPNDLLVNSTGDGTIGRSGLAGDDCIGFVFDSHILRVRTYSEINHSLICSIINSDYGQGLIESIKGATSTKQTELGVSNLSNFPIPLPPLAEQQRIVSKLGELMKMCDDLEASIKESQQQNEALLQEVLREALEVKEFELNHEL
jgi:type I restriction enzyme S subunit